MLLTIVNIYLCRMHKEVKITGDGSKTIYLPEWDEVYHSSHGALNEALHVFVEHGLKCVQKSSFQVFEMGFGTGLNALLTYQFALNHLKTIEYTGVEAFPLAKELWSQLGYELLFDEAFAKTFHQMHNTPWNERVNFNDSFLFTKFAEKIENMELPSDQFDVIFYDAFGPRVQSELWSIALFQKMFRSLKYDGFLVTYCAKGEVKRNLKAAGFQVEALPGPPGKREMTRAWKKASF